MIRPRWDSPVVRRAIELGVDKSHLKTAIINRIKVNFIIQLSPCGKRGGNSRALIGAANDMFIRE